MAIFAKVKSVPVNIDTTAAITVTAKPVLDTPESTEIDAAILASVKSVQIIPEMTSLRWLSLCQLNQV